MRVALEVLAVLEGARLALVDVDRHQARRGLGGTIFHLRPVGKPAPPSYARAWSSAIADWACGCADALDERSAAAVATVGRIVDGLRGRASTCFALTAFAIMSSVACGIGLRLTTATGALLAAADARRADHANVAHAEALQRRHR